MSVEDAKKAICETLDRLQADALEAAREKVFEDPSALFKQLFKEDMYLHIEGIGYRGKEDLPPLTVYLRDIGCGEYLQTYDPVGDAISAMEDEGADSDEAGEILARSIATLQSGIDRLRAFEEKHFAGGVK